MGSEPAGEYYLPKEMCVVIDVTPAFIFHLEPAREVPTGGLLLKGNTKVKGYE